MRRIAEYFVFAGLIAVPAGAVAQWVPVTADKVETTTVTNTATETVTTTVKTSKYFRDTAGSELTLTDVPSSNGTSHSEVATLLDNRGHGLYKLDYGAKTAVEQARNASVQMPRTADQQQKNVIGHEMIEHFDCAAMPVFANYGDGKLTTIGRRWAFLQDDVTIKMDVLLKQPGFDTHIVSLLTNVNLDKNPDPALFRVPSSFTLKQSTAGIH